MGVSGRRLESPGSVSRSPGVVVVNLDGSFHDHHLHLDVPLIRSGQRTDELSLVLEDAVAKHELLLIGSALAIGYLFDSALALTGILGFSDQALTTIGSPSPYWMLALWINLAAILRTALDWLSGRFVMAALLGGIIGPPSYLAGEHLGALHLGESLYLTIACVAVEWALAMPLLIWISDRLSPDSPASAIGETA